MTSDTTTIEADIDMLPDTRAEQAVATVQRGGELSVPAATSEAATIRGAILELARDKDFNVEKLRALTDLQNSVEDRQAERAFNIAFVGMQAELPVIKRDGSLEYEKEKGRPETKYLISKYARYEDIARAIGPVLAKHGFSVSFDVQPRQVDGGGLMVSCILRHNAGHVHRGPALPVPLDTSGGKNNIQSYGSALSYGKRYGLFAVLNVITEGDDDDGVAAGGKSISFDEAAAIKKLVSEANIGEGKPEDERRTEIIEWFNDMLGYPLEKGYASIRQEDSTRIQRALLSLKARRLTTREREVTI